MNLDINNVTNLSCSLWSRKQLEIIRDSIADKNDKAYIINDQNSIKGTPAAVQYCKKKGISYSLQNKMPYDDFIKTLGTYSSFVFFRKHWKHLVVLF